MDRMGYYLSKILQLEGKFVKINLIKSRTSKRNRIERRELFNNIKTTLDMMGIKYVLDPKDNNYKIKVLPHE